MRTWLENHNTSPKTNQTLTNRNYVLNDALKLRIESHRNQLLPAISDNFSTFEILSGRVIRSDWQQRPRIKIKLSLFGASGVGKTTLAQILQRTPFMANMRLPTTTFVDTYNYYLSQLFEDKFVIIIELIDPPGQERFEAVVNSFFRGCHGALFLADSTNVSSLERLEEYWYKKLEKLAMDNLQCAFLCTKIDQFENQDLHYRDSFLKQVQEFCSLHGMPMFQVTAYRGDYVEYVVKQLVIRILTNDTLINDSRGMATSMNCSIDQRRQFLSTRSLTPLCDSDRHKQKKRHSPKCCK